MRQSEGITIRFAEDRDTPAVRALWEQCFPGEPDFTGYFFAHLYAPRYNLLLLREGTLCAMAQMLPYQLQNGPASEPVTYIYGACTHPAHRRQHLMDRLLHESFDIDRANGRAASFLIPQEDWLFGFYARFGYRTAFYVSEWTAPEPQAALPLAVRPAGEGDLSAMDGLYHRYLGIGPYLCRPADEWRRQLAFFRATGGEVLCAEGADGGLDGYAFVWPGDQQIWAQELICPPAAKEGWAAALQQRFGPLPCRMTGPQFSNPRPLGCMLRYDGAQLADGYINLMLN